jgi:hypothetical protein
MPGSVTITQMDTETPKNPETRPSNTRTRRERVVYAIETSRLAVGVVLGWMRQDARRAAFASTALASILTVAVAGVVEASVSKPTVSRYISWMTGNTEQDAQTAHELACATADGGGVVLLAFGRQVVGGTRSFDGPDILYKYDHIAAVATGYASGLEECTDGSWNLAIATSNYRLDDPTIAYTYGADWQRMVAGVAAGKFEQVSISGGIDLEPGWGGRAAAEQWLQGWRTGETPLVANASADGCPVQDGTLACANGWNIKSLARMVWGREQDSVLPQIYRKDGIQAAQWGVISRRFALDGGQVKFAGVMTQVRACELVRNKNCPQLSLDPESARTQMQLELGSLAAVEHVTDVGWG